MKKLIKKLFEPNEKGLYTPGWTSIKSCCQAIAWNQSSNSNKKWKDEFEQQLGRSLLKYANYRMFIACRLWDFVEKTK